MRIQRGILRAAPPIYTEILCPPRHFVLVLCRASVLLLLLHPRAYCGSIQKEIRRFPPHTYRPGSYSLDAIGEISECIVIRPSNGRSGGGLTIFAST